MADIPVKNLAVGPVFDGTSAKFTGGNSAKPPASWKDQPAELYAPTWTEGNPVLMMWGPLQFTVYPLNFHEMDHETGTDWARKEIAGAPIYREWVGENDEQIYLRGKLFPYRLGGLDERNRNVNLLNAYRLAGAAHILIRGDGEVLGWYVCEKLVRAHTFISSEGVGKMITFEAVMARVPMPASDQYYTDTWHAGHFAGPQS